MEDSALTLKKMCERGDNVSIEKARDMLGQSELVDKLLTEPKWKPDTYAGLRAYVWRLLELSEIPYAYTLDKVRKWLDILADRSFVQEGFSLTGDKDGLLACHNAMVTNIFIKMEWDDRSKIDAGINWILDYQSIERGEECSWPGNDLYNKYGGCMKKTPCYYGVVKSMIALTEYKKRFGASERVEKKLSRGLEYILKRRVYKKLSGDKPIEPSVIENFYPYTYKTNIIEILSLLKANGLIGDERCIEALEVLRQKKQQDGFWQAEATYMKTAWVEFDKLKKPGLWISYVISSLVND